jgi:hypothetical protein
MGGSRLFEVVGSDTGLRYRLTYKRAMNVHQLDPAGKPVSTVVFRP